MTTFQVLLQSFLKALTLTLPVSEAQTKAISQNLLNWTLPFAEIELLVLSTATLAILFFFRFDWLGMISAGITSVFRPLSLKADTRTLDQQSLIFLLIAFVPVRILSLLLDAPPIDVNLIPPPLLSGACMIAGAFALLGSSRWNKRINGLNHLRISHAFWISMASLLSLIPGFSLAGLLWAGFAFCNYNHEAIFKISGMLLGLSVFSKTASTVQSVSFPDAFAQIGYLNSAAVIVVAFTVIWISLEHLQKSLSEATYKNFQWLGLLSGVAFFALYFLGHFPE